MTTGDCLREGADTFLTYPALTVIGFIGAFASALITFALGSGSVIAPAGLTGAMYLVYADILVSMTVVGAIMAFIDVMVGEGDHTVLRYAVYRLPSFIGATLVAAFLILGGLVMFLLPGIYIGVRLALFPFYVVIEKESALTALGSSWDAAAGRFWYIFALVGIVVVIGAGSMELLALLPSGLMEEAGLVHTAFFTPWSIAVVYHLYTDIENSD